MFDSHFFLLQVCRKLLQLDSRRIDARDIGGRTALHLAAFKVGYRLILIFYIIFNIF